jgi:formylglycine-generating enzyme required for sulfatase activity
MRSYAELFQASGYAGRQDQFDDLIRLLDSELRLITPTDPEGTAENSELVAGQGLDGGHYQLTHDYFVHSLRDWLTQKQKETARGRAALQLAEAAADWNRRPVKRLLPSLFDFLRWRLLASARRWSDAERNMMAQAARQHVLRAIATCALLLLAAIAVAFSISAKHAEALREQLKTTIDAAQNNRGAAVPYAIRDLKKLPSPQVRAELQARYGRLPDNRKLGLAYARAEYGDVDVPFLVSQVKSAPVEEFDNLMTALGNSRVQARSHGLAEIKSSLERQDWHTAARLAIQALYLGEEHPALDLCRTDQRPDPIQRTIFIDEFPRWHGNLVRLLPTKQALEAVSFRSALCLGLAGISPDHLTADEQQAWQLRLTDWHQISPDPATHSAAEVALRRWQVDLQQIEPSSGPVGNRDWFVNSRGMTMLKISPGHFARHAPEIPDSAVGYRHDVKLTRAYYLSDREVSARDFFDFINDNDWPDTRRPLHWLARMKRYSSDPASIGAEYPVDFTSWLDAASFCNWLSAKENRSPCYLTTGRKLQPDDLREPQYEELEISGDGNGYRLPTEAEWEYACRAGTTSEFCCGADRLLLRQYAVFRSARLERRAMLFPNQWGLFDMHGNAYEWCADRYAPYVDADLIDPIVHSGWQRVFRGGSFLDAAESCRSANRNGLAPWVWARGTGFRVALSAEDNPTER